MILSLVACPTETVTRVAKQVCANFHCNIVDDRKKSWWLGKMDTYIVLYSYDGILHADKSEQRQSMNIILKTQC